MSFLTSQPIDAQQLVASLHAPDEGAVVTFVGLVRDHHAGREVALLEYSAYGEMAERIAGEIVAEARAKWDVRVAMAHRLGTLAVGDTAVVVAVAAHHRGAAFEACRWLIDALKSRVPIWKRERYGDGSEAWVDPTAASGVVPVAS